MARQTSTIYYYKNINLSRDYSNVCDHVDFANLSPYLVFTDTEISVITHDLTSGSFKINRNINSLSYINYIAILNNSNDRAVIFAFIDNLKYIADTVTEIEFSIDLFSTYCQSLDYQDCYIVRKTTSDDTLYKYLEPEPISGGDYKTNEIVTEFTTQWNYGFTACTDSTGTPVQGSIIDNVWTSAQVTGLDSPGAVMDYLGYYNANGHIDQVCSVFQYPKDCGTSVAGDSIHKSTYDRSYPFPMSGNKYTLDNYVPKNNKLLNYPYRRVVIIDTDGNTLTLKPELMTNGVLEWRVEKSVIPASQIVLTIDNYDGITYDNQREQRLFLLGFPEVTWNSDNYRAWLARNKPSLDATAVKTIANMVGNVATGNIGTAIESGANTLLDIETAKASNQVDSNQIHKGGNIGIDVMNNHFGFIIYFQSINAREASLIDNYFTAYGYAINKVDYFRPSRQRFDYVETRGELFRREVEGSGIPNIAVDTLNKRANMGLRIWHSIYTLNRRDLTSRNPIV